MPPIESRVSFGLIFVGHASLVECLMAGMLEMGFGKALVIMNEAVANELDLGLTWDGS